MIPGESPPLLLPKEGQPTFEERILAKIPVDENNVVANCVVCKDPMRALVADGEVVTAM